MRRPGGAVAPAMLPEPRGGFLLRTPADFSNQDHALGLGIVVEELDHVEVRSAVDRVAPDADAGALADAATGQLPDRLIGQRPGATDDADVASLVNVTRSDA